MPSRDVSASNIRRDSVLEHLSPSQVIEQLLVAAASALHAGHPEKAGAIYREILKSDPNNRDLIFSLAVAENQYGRFKVAEEILLAAANRFPSDARFPLVLGRNFKALGKLDESVKWYRRALEIKPDYLDAMVSLGVALWRTGGFDESVKILERARLKQPASFEVTANLGNALFESGRHEEAMGVYREALALKPSSADAHNNLGRALLALGKKDEATLSFERALELGPEHAEALYNLGTLRLDRGDVNAAAQNFAKAVAHNAAYIDGYIALAKVLYDVGELKEALRYLDAVIQIRPEDPEGFIWRGTVLREQGDIPAALECFERVAALRPDNPDGYAMLGTTYWLKGEHEKAAKAGAEALLRNAQYPPVLNLQGNLAILAGRVKEALGWYEKAVSNDPAYADAFDNLLFVSNYHDEMSADRLCRQHRQWGENVIAYPRLARERRQNPGKIRIGFVSPDFRNHSVAFFVEPIFANLDRTRFELHLYSSDRRMDAISKRFSDYATQWTNITALGDEPAAEMIAQDEIDILIDLAGHTAGNRLGVFARRPATVQITYLGYPTATGLPAITHRLTDWFTDPAGSEALSCEEPVRLSASYFCYQPPADAPEVSVLPAAAQGHITFVSFNNLAKISPTTIRLWAQVLKAVPDSTLLLKNRGLSDESVQRATSERLASAGAGAARIRYSAWEGSTQSHLALYGGADIALDTYPYNGATTTCESLWMGVPVVTLRGTTHASRMGASILSAAGYPHLITGSEEEYVARCAAMASDIAALARMRQGMREQVRNSALMAHAAFTRNFEAVLCELLSSPKNSEAALEAQLRA
ncbi:MAG: tetratricopeptide repeat protein [Burkholderiales bacterium]